jgi:hypothetical protein
MHIISLYAQHTYTCQICCCVIGHLGLVGLITRWMPIDEVVYESDRVSAISISSDR